MSGDSGLTPGTELPPYAVRARNLAAESENRIHDDAVAREYGFRGGLVAGITTYAYMTRPVAEALGREWLERGTMAGRFVAPVYDGDLVTVLARVEAAGDGGARIAVSLEDSSGRTCATGEATLPEADGEPPDPGDYPEAALPSERPDATREHLETVAALGTVRRTFRAPRAAEFLAAIDDDFELYRGGDVAHPGWIVWDANQALARNVRLGPWIHVSTDARHFSLVGDGDVVSTRGRVASVFERKEHEFVELDLLVMAEQHGVSRPVWHLRHTAIYRLAPA